MGRLLSYSGISTKIRAMQSKLISESEIQEIASVHQRLTCSGLVETYSGICQSMGGS